MPEFASVDVIDIFVHFYYLLLPFYIPEINVHTEINQNQFIFKFKFKK